MCVGLGVHGLLSSCAFRALGAIKPIFGGQLGGKRNAVDVTDDKWDLITVGFAERRIHNSPWSLEVSFAKYLQKGWDGHFGVLLFHPVLIIICH